MMEKKRWGVERGKNDGECRRKKEGEKRQERRLLGNNMTE